MGLFRAGIIGGVGFITIEYIKQYNKVLSSLPVLNILMKNKINYCYFILIIIFLIELIF